ncbi:mediator of RNA polymerase II transcription subunit 26 [Spea bombifrons]|uniref:mediator of RNA polymerase II transcription subunit 26 n=1 Tax=Spea bombifrons TaxID=233779 RepID=UPI00234984CF|nr:mediator of RNA polymerase II transcription subunit 26 [Spea bombifrons]
MTAAPVTPREIRERLLQAIDPHSNIRNMVAVLEVISSLEKYPITKEALEETRLGKLINDVRKKTSNEELAKRAKKLLRSWQKLIEPVAQSESSARGTPNPPGSANGGSAHNCKAETAPTTLLSGKPVQELKSRNDIQRAHSPKSDKLAIRKRKGENKDGTQATPCKVAKSSHELFQNSSSSPPTNGVGGSPPDSIPSPLDGVVQPTRTDPAENDKHVKIPINAVRPHTNSPGLVKHPSTSSLLKVAILQQNSAGLEDASHQPRSPRCASFSPRGTRAELVARQHTTYAPKVCVPSPSQRMPGVDAAHAPSYQPPAHPPTPPAIAKRLESPGRDMLAVSSPHKPLEQLSLTDCQHPSRTSQQHTPHGPRSCLPHMDSQTPRTGFSPEPSKMDSDDAASGSDSHKRRKSRGRGEQEGHSTDGTGKPARVKKERKLTFDFMTGQIKPLTNKDSSQAECSAPSEQHRTETDKQDPKLGLPNPFEQANWKELSCNEIIQYYLNQQSSLLSSSGVHTQSAHYYMSEYLKQEECTKREAKKTHVLVPLVLPSELPGRTRDVNSADIDRIHNQHWPGVNGCHDTQGNWYDWTQCISLDPHGDDGRLNVLPYVCLD